jgi:hypothetical protein
MKRFFLPVFLFFLLLAISCGSSSSPSNPVTGNKWTVMIYLDADNELVPWALTDIEEMQTIGSTQNVTVILQYDKEGATTKRYKVEKGSLTLIEDLSELNMSDPETIENFVTYSVTNYPADHYALILWDHGQGWKGRIVAGSTSTKSMFNDYDNGIYNSFLSNYYIALALANAQSLTGVKLDILGIDACEMSVIEAAYEFREVADILVGSQELLSVWGWDYDDLLKRLTNKPSMTPVDFALAMVDSFKNYYSNSSLNDQTIAALTLTNKYSSDGASDISTLAQSVDNLALRLISLMEDSSTQTATLQTITNTRETVQEFDYIYVDLVDFSRLLDGDNSPVIQEYNKILLGEYHGSEQTNAHGLSIVFFDRSSSLDYYYYDSDYCNFDPETETGSRISFINQFNWDEMLHTYFALQYPDLTN